MFYSITPVDWYWWWKHGRTGACAEVHRSLLAMARPGEKRTGSSVITRTYRGYQGGVGNTDEVHPHARWCGSESSAALAVVFRVGEATIGHSVTP